MNKRFIIKHIIITYKMAQYQIMTLHRQSFNVETCLPFEELQIKIERLAGIPKQNQKFIFMGTHITPDNYPTMKNKFSTETCVHVLHI